MEISLLKEMLGCEPREPGRPDKANFHPVDNQKRNCSRDKIVDCIWVEESWDSNTVKNASFNSEGNYSGNEKRTKE